MLSARHGICNRDEVSSDEAGHRFGPRHRRPDGLTLVGFPVREAETVQPEVQTSLAGRFSAGPRSGG